jgi:fatty acid-binding protein DegV
LIKIVTDSAADMPVEELRALGIAIAPLFIQFPEGGVSAADQTPDEF